MVPLGTGPGTVVLPVSVVAESRAAPALIDPARQWVVERSTRAPMGGSVGFAQLGLVKVNDVYAVVDVETTGLYARSHRIVEVAVVHTDLWGEWQGQWTTLIDPVRDVGPTSVHGITATDVTGAPRFTDVVGKLNAMFAGRTLVAHNLYFDHSFLAAEYQRAGAMLPVSAEQGICTMKASSHFLPWAGRTLQSCCAVAGIRNEAAHTALADARATAQLLRHYLRCGHPSPPPWAELARRNQLLSWPQVGPSEVIAHHRGASAAAARNPDVWLAQLSKKMPRIDSVPQADPYLALLDRALADRDLSNAEIRELGLVSNELGLTNRQLLKLHREYVRGLCQVAYADGDIGRDEHADLVRVTELLRLTPADLGAAIDNARSRRFPATRLPAAGSLIAFTGDHPAFSRNLLVGMAERHGLTVHDSVTRKVALLVASDFHSQSAKARKARDYAIPIMPVATFAKLVGLVR